MHINSISGVISARLGYFQVIVRLLENLCICDNEQLLRLR